MKNKLKLVSLLLTFISLSTVAHSHESSLPKNTKKILCSNIKTDYLNLKVILPSLEVHILKLSLASPKQIGYEKDQIETLTKKLIAANDKMLKTIDCFTNQNKLKDISNSNEIIDDQIKLSLMKLETSGHYTYGTHSNKQLLTDAYGAIGEANGVLVVLDRATAK